MLRWELAKAVFSEFRERVLHVGVELFGPEASGRTFEPIQPLGLRARPRDPDVDAEKAPTEGAGVLLAMEGSEGFAMPTGDPRAENEIPEGQQGSVYLYACTEEKRPSYIGIEGDGSHQYLAQYPDGSAAHAITMEVHEAGEENIQLSHGEGHGIRMLAGGVIMIVSPDGKNWIKVSNDGIETSGAVKMAGGASLGDSTAGQNIITKLDTDVLVAFLNNALFTVGLTVAGGIAKMAVQIIPPSGSSQAKAAP